MLKLTIWAYFNTFVIFFFFWGGEATGERKYGVWEMTPCGAATVFHLYCVLPLAWKGLNIRWYVAFHQGFA